jgi:hypothetical protein
VIGSGSIAEIVDQDGQAVLGGAHLHDRDAIANDLYLLAGTHPADDLRELPIQWSNWWYSGGTLAWMPTHYPRIQVTEDRELSAALRAAAPHLPAGLPRSRQVRELAIAGARHLSGEPADESRRQELLEQLAQSFDEPEAAGIDWDLLREGKQRAWPVR